MKKLTLLFFTIMLLSSDVLAQKEAETSTNMIKRNRKTALKTNILSPISLILELGLTKHIAISGNFAYFPTTKFGDVTKSWGQIEFTEPSKGFGFEANYYPFAIDGFYFGGFLQYRSAKVNIEKLYTGTNDGGPFSTTIKGNLLTSLTQYGGQLGYQKIAKFGFVFNVGLGIGYHKIDGVPDLLPDNSATDNKFLDALNNNYKGFGIRPILAIGWAF
jgi:hypothetical protein